MRRKASRNRTAVVAALLMALLVPVAPPVHAGPPGLDPEWGDNGMLDVPAAAGGGYIRPIAAVVSGTTTYVAAAASETDPSPVVLALDGAGKPLTSFGGTGRVALPRDTSHPQVDGMAVDSQGRVLVTVNVYDGAWAGYDLVRLTPTGSLDTTFDGDGRLSVRAPEGVSMGAGPVRTGPAGSVTLGVWQSSPSSGYVSSVERLTSAGTPDAGFGGGRVTMQPDLRITGLVVESSGRAVVGLGGTSGSWLIALLPDGSHDPGFGSDGTVFTDQASDLWRLADGTLLRQHQGYGGTPARLAAWTPAGAADVGFGEGGTQGFEPGGMALTVTDVAQLTGGDLVVNVHHASEDFYGTNQLYRLSADGEPLEVLPDDVDPARPLGVRALVAGPDDGLLVVGSYTDGPRRHGGTIARLLGDVAVRATGFSPLPPTRVLDTRTGLGAPKARLGAQQTLRLSVAGVGGVPADAAAVVLNVTAVDTTRRCAPRLLFCPSESYVTVWPAGGPRPTVSNLNVREGTTRPNAVTVKVGQGGAVDLYNAGGSMDVVVDVAGYYSASGGMGFTGLAAPARLLDTRVGLGAPLAPATPSAPVRLQVTGEAAVPATATAVVMNVTAVHPTTDTHVTVWPGGTSRPTASNLNLRAGEIAPNLVTVKLGEDGSVALAPGAGAVHLVADVAGWYGPDGDTRFVPLQPKRLLDTRTDASPVASLETLPAFVEMGGVPGNATAVVLNLTAVSPTAPGHVTAFPHGQPLPLASNLNFTPGLTVPNLAVVGVGDLGLVDLHNSQGDTHLIADVAGYFTD